MERIWPWPHSEWFKPYAAGWYAWVYLGEDITREETLARLDELLGGLRPPDRDVVLAAHADRPTRRGGVVATRTKKRTQEELHALVDELVAGGRNRTEAFAHLCETLGIRASTIAAAYYRVERAKTRTQRPEENTMAKTTTAEPPAPATLEQELPKSDPSRESFKDVRPKADGHTVETLHIAFGGGVDLDPVLHVDREFFAALRLGIRITLTVECEVAAKGPRLQRDKDGIAHTTDIAKLRIESFDITRT
jgi:hypothetical protein